MCQNYAYIYRTKLHPNLHGAVPYSSLLRLVFQIPFISPPLFDLLPLLANWQSQERSQWVLVWAVSTRKLFTVPLLTDNSPPLHRIPRHSNEESGCAGAGNHKDTHPGNNLKEIVWACHPVEAEALWNATRGGSGWTEVGENDVGVKVGQLAVNVGGNTSPDEVLCILRQRLHRGSSQGVWCKDPV